MSDIEHEYLKEIAVLKARVAELEALITDASEALYRWNKNLGPGHAVEAYHKLTDEVARIENQEGGERESGGEAGAGKLSDGSSAAANPAAPFPEDMPTSMRGTRYEQPMCPEHGWAYTRKRGDSWFCFLTQTGEVTERVSESHWRVVRKPGAKT